MRRSLYIGSAGTLSYATYSTFSTKQSRRLPVMTIPKTAEALYEGNSSEHGIGDLMRKEFQGNLTKYSDAEKAKFDFKMKTRDEHLKELKNTETEFDILIVGGGANGAGVVLDAASRGLKCAVIDSYDFASGTSSKSTKMAHGGIRYF